MGPTSGTYTKRRRRIIEIDDEKCDGCGLCVSACHEGAIQIIDGKARLVSDSYCDGLGDCLGECPQGAITIVEREAEEFDERAVAEHVRRIAKPLRRPSGTIPVAPRAVEALMQPTVHGPRPQQRDENSPRAPRTRVAGGHDMERYMKQGIKDIIRAFPEVGEILEGYGIACVPCTVGTCRLEDVIQIHDLPPEDEALMMAQIEKAIYPDREVTEVQAPARPRRPTKREITYSPPVRRLVDEHSWIQRLLARIPAMVEATRASGQVDAELMREVLDFIRGYADQFHHMKEENVLFDYTDKDAEVIRVIYEDHDRARTFVRVAAEAIENGDVSALCDNLLAYRELLTEHIAKENDVLYPYIDRGLTTRQVGEVFRRFEEADGQAADDVPEKYERFIIALEAKFE